MTFDRKSLVRKLSTLADLAGRPSRLVIGFSGGLDSTVLLHSLAQARDDSDASVLAVYVDHGLHDDSAQWGEHCQAFAEQLGVDFCALAVHIDTDTGQELKLRPGSPVTMPCER